MFAQLEKIIAVQNFFAGNIEKVHNRVDVGVVLQTEHVTEFVHGDAVQFRAAHSFRSYRVHSNLPPKVGPIGDLRPRYDNLAQDIGAAIDNLHGTRVETGLFMEVCFKHGIPETESPPKCSRPGPGRIDLDADIPQNCVPQIVIFCAGCIGARPVRTWLLLRASGNLRSATEPCREDAG